MTNEPNFVEIHATANDALQGLTSWGEFYEALQRNVKEYRSLEFSLKQTLFYNPDDFLGRWCKQVAKEREINHVGFSSHELNKILPAFVSYYKEEGKTES